jgi:hypothetical protein
MQILLIHLKKEEQWNIIKLKYLWTTYAELKKCNYFLVLKQKPSLPSLDIKALSDTDKALSKTWLVFRQDTVLSLDKVLSGL